MTLEPSLAILALLSSLIPAVFSALTVRAVKGIDGSIATLTGKVDALTAKDTEILVELAALRTRVLHLELEFQRRDSRGDK